ncbi:hypothetical protein ABT160_40015 [Streptomyces sp. NPDC001941]|uniref:hypothetical protein n=1 Tax=Streptomyces sp. NPDC001941 TaxID=3154659 RepID=UPI003318B513
MSRNTHPEATAGPTGTGQGAPGTGEKAGNGPQAQAIVPAQQRYGAGADRSAASGPTTAPAPSDAAQDQEAAPAPTTAPASAQAAGPEKRGQAAASVGRNGRAFARTTGAGAGTVAGTAPAPSEQDEDAPAATDREPRKGWPRAAKVAVTASCGVALAAVAAPFLVSAVPGVQEAVADVSPVRGSSTGPAGAALRATALTMTAIGYAPGVAGGGDGTVLAKARQDSRRFALAAWAASGRPADHGDALYGALLRSSGAYDHVVKSFPGLAPKGRVLAADVAPEGHKLAVLTQQKGEELARMQVLVFGKDAAAPKWATVGPAIDPASAFAISDCGGMIAFAEPDGHREVWNLMGADPVKAFAANGDGVDRAAGERQFLDFNNDTHRVLYAYGPADALRGEVVNIHTSTPTVEGDVALPRGKKVDEVRLDGLKPTAVTLPEGSGEDILTRYGDRVAAGGADGPLTDASHRYVVERLGAADDVYAVRVSMPQLGRTYQAVLPPGSGAADVAGGPQAMVVPVSEDGRTMRMIVVTGDALTVVDAPRAEGAAEKGLPEAAAVVAQTCKTSPAPLTARDLTMLPAAEREAASAWPCD